MSDFLGNGCAKDDPPYLHKDLMEVPTYKLADELLHRVKMDKTQLETNPHAFADLSLFWRLTNPQTTPLEEAIHKLACLLPTPHPVDTSFDYAAFREHKVSVVREFVKEILKSAGVKVS